mgnify:CR=1 FL=1
MWAAWLKPPVGQAGAESKRSTRNQQRQQHVYARAACPTREQTSVRKDVLWLSVPAHVSALSSDNYRAPTVNKHSPSCNYRTVWSSYAGPALPAFRLPPPHPLAPRCCPLNQPRTHDRACTRNYGRYTRSMRLLTRHMGHLVRLVLQP